MHILFMINVQEEITPTYTCIKYIHISMGTMKLMIYAKSTYICNRSGR